MFTRKSLFVALTVIAMLAMLVPATFAAPEVVTKVVVTAPTEAAPVFVTSPGTVAVAYSIYVSGQQPFPVIVTFELVNQYGAPVATATITIPAGTLVNGENKLTYSLAVPPGLPEGFYHVRVCIDDGIDPYCAMQSSSVQVDNTGPTVTLERPVDVAGCTWVTGNQYELFGMATDNVAVHHAWFQYTTDPANTPIVIGNENANFVGQNATPVAGFPGEYRSVWNSSLVPDGPGFVRFCAVDTAGSPASCTGWVDVCIENRVKIDLQKGWNLISTPLMLYNSAIGDVLTHVWNPMTGQLWNQAPIDAVVTTRDGGATWMSWMAGAPGSLTEIQDGYGYWVHVLAPAQIEFVGTWLSVGPNAPPEYPVREGWNLIGYTHFGTPTMGPWPEFNKTVADYLGFPMMVSVESMYRYDAVHGFYIQVDEMFGERFMRQGAGYWLALAEGTEGTINP